LKISHEFHELSRIELKNSSKFVKFVAKIFTPLSSYVFLIMSIALFLEWHRINTMTKNSKKTCWASTALCLWMVFSLTGCAKSQASPTPANPPQVEFTSPSPVGSRAVLRNVKFEVKATASGGRSIEKVEFLIDGVPLPDGADTDSPYEYSWEATEKFGVTRTITAVVYDNQGASASASIEVKFFNGVEKAPMPTSRYAFTADVVDNKIYVIGGHDLHFNLVEAYDPATNVWSTKTPSNAPHAAHASCVIADKIYVFGGGTDKDIITEVEAYDPSTDSWTKKAPIPLDSGAPVSLQTCAVVNGKAYLMGGLAASEPARVAEYDPVADSWRLTNSVKQEYGGEALSLNNLIYFIGGCEFRSMGQCDHPRDLLQSYDPTADAWTNHRPMLTPHTHHCATLLNDKIYVMGGGDIAARAVNDATLVDKHLEVYDPATDSWTALPGLPIMDGLVNFGCNAVNGKIYIIAPEHAYEYSPDW
jgi:N-acetylneuraminic acid mutarotase